MTKMERAMTAWMKTRMTLMVTVVETSEPETLLEEILPMTRASCPTVT
jgi:hypothetical protein